ncbi:MAG: hypothetical protein HXX20_11325 [Chloroflexi bacterium]|nr:hypothetical protein [Chloroflexota bacterium]
MSKKMGRDLLPCYDIAGVPAETIPDLLLQHQVRRTALLQAQRPNLLTS